MPVKEFRLIFTLNGEHFQTSWFLEEVRDQKIRALKECMKVGDAMHVVTRSISATVESRHYTKL